MQTKTYLIIWAVGIPLGLAISYGLALAGHPNSYWLWHNVFGIL